MHRTSAGLGLAMLGLLAACDVPTSAPKYTTEWNVPAKTTSISVNSLLPSGVSVTSDNSAFQATVSPSATTIARVLGQDCAACSAANGATVPKPAFVGGGTSTVSLPSGIASATLVRDTLTVTINNGFNFDPIRPSATARGYFVIRVTNGGAVVGRDSLDGSTIALPAGGAVTRKIPLTGTVSAASGLQIATTLNSPVGDPIQMDASRSISVSGSTGPLYISSASVNLVRQSVTSSASDFDLSSVDKSITDHLDDGSLILTVTNPFSATGNLTVNFTGGSAPVAKPVTLGAGTTSQTISLSKSELDALFGHKLNISFSGTVNGSNVTVSPGQTVAVSTRLQLGVNTGGK